jgi:hypothetical protein
MIGTDLVGIGTYLLTIIVHCSNWCDSWQLSLALDFITEEIPGQRLRGLLKAHY